MENPWPDGRQADSGWLGNQYWILATASVFSVATVTTAAIVCVVKMPVSDFLFGSLTDIRYFA